MEFIYLCYTLSEHHLHYNEHFSVDLGQPVIPQFYSSTLRTFGNKWHTFLQSRCPSYHKTNHVGALKETQSTDLQPQKIPFSSSITGLPSEKTLLPLHRLSHDTPVPLSIEGH